MTAMWRTSSRSAWLLGAMAVMCVGTSTDLGSQEEPGGVREFATAFAANYISGGVVAPEVEVSRKSGRPPSAATHAEAYKRGVPALVAAFNQAHSEFRATQNSGLVHIVATDRPKAVDQLLTRQIVIDRGEQLTAVDAVFKKLVGALRQSPVLALAGIGIMPGPECRLTQLIQVRQGSVTVRDFLDGVVSQAPGLVWLITYDADTPDMDAKVGFVCPDGATLKMKIIQ